MHDIYFWDLENYPPRKVSGFPSREDLERLAMLREYKRPLADELISRAIAGRDYQIRAIRAVMEGIEKKKRDFLLVMATGTGKTRTCIALIDALMRSRHIQRTLFLVDRIPLRQQAVDAFKEYLPDEPRWPNNSERDFTKDRRIYVSTYPAMSSGKKQGEISCFDLAYTLFADEENIPCLHFLLNDKKELMDDKQLVKISEFVNRNNIQFVASILKDKLPDEINKDDYFVVKLSQNDKLFRIKE